jgi:hypothetical protein
MKYLYKPVSAFLFTAILILQSSTFVFSQDDKYDAVYLRLKKEYTLNPDGSMDYRYIKMQKLQTYRAFHNLYGETFIVYNPGFQNLKIKEAYIIMADGNKTSSPENAFNEVLPAFAANAPAYNKLREMVITHAGTERNAVVNLDYLLHSDKGFYPCLMGNELMCEVEPVKELTIVIRVPSSIKFNYTVLNSKVIPAITKEGDFQVYTFNEVNIPAISTEELQVGGNELYPRLLFSTAADRNSLYTGFIKQEAFSYGLNNEIKQTVAGLIKTYKEKSSLVLKLQDMVVNEMRLYPVPMKYMGFTCRTAEQTWNSNGGTLLEKAVLLTALLRESGITETNPELVIRKNLYDPTIGSLLDAEDIIVKTNIPDVGVVYLSVSSLNSQDLQDTYIDRVFVELKKPEISIAKTPPCINKIKFDGSFSLNEKKQLSGSINCVETNGTNPYLLILRDKDKAKNMFGGGLSSSDLKDPVEINSGITESSMSFGAQKDKPFHSDSNYYFLQLPLMTNGTEGLGVHLLPKDRTTPLEMASRIEETDDFSYVLTGKLKLFLPSEKKEIKNDAGEFIFEVKTEGQKVTVHKSLKLNKRIIEPSEYAGFKSLFDHWNADRYRELVFVE